MIKFSPAVQALVKEPRVVKFYLVQIGDVGLTNYYRDLLYGGLVFENSGELVALDPPEITSVVTRQRFSATLQDVPEKTPWRTRGNLIGMPATVWIVLEDADGEPLLTPEDVLMVYQGKIDSSNYRVDTASIGSRLTDLTFASPMADLDNTNMYMASQDYADRNFPGDRSYEQVLAGSSTVSLYWGKI